MKALRAIVLFFAIYFINQVIAAEPTNVSLRLLPTSDSAKKKLLLDELGRYFVARRVETDLPAEQILKQYCGHSDQELLSRLQKANSVDALRSIGQRQVTVPPCPYWAFDRQLNLPRDVTEEEVNAQIVSLAGYGYDSRTKKAIDRRNQTSNVMLNIRDGRPIDIPYVARPVSYTLRPDSPLEAREAVKTIEQKLPSLKILSTTGLSLNDGGAADFNLIGPASGGVCNASGAPKPLFNTTNLIQLINTQRLDGVSEATTKILVVDTGISADEDRLLLYVNEKESSDDAKAQFDNDKDGFRNNAFGIDISSKSGPPTRLPNYELSAHGTEVAGLTLGGLEDPALTTFLRGKLNLELVQIIDKHVNPDDKVEYVVSGAGIATALVYARASADSGRQSATIINMSLEGGAGSYAEVESELGQTTALVVAAAGNKGWDELKALYVPFPLSYRSRFSRRLLIVGAYDQNDPAQPLTTFTNLGSSYVDIAAPGCNVDTISVSPKRQYVTGTSFSAPLVSFAAGLLNYLGVRGSDIIKARLIATSDFDPSYRTGIFSSGRLNIERAVTLRRAFISEETSAHTPLLTSYASNPIASYDAPCAAGEPRAQMLEALVPLPVLLKIVGYTDAQNSRQLRFYYRVNSAGEDKIAFLECRASQGKITLAEDKSLDWSKLFEYVPLFHQ